MQDLGEYDIASEFITSHGGSPAPPDSDEYDELNPALLYTDPKEGGEGDAWRTFGLSADNIHTDNYASNKAVVSTQVRGGGDITRMPPGVATAANPRRSNDLPIGRQRQDQRSMQARHEQPDESLYSITAGSASTVPAATAQSPSPPRNTAGHEVYDHLNWHQKQAKPAPVPRKSDTSAIRKPPPASKPRPPKQTGNNVPIYDHLDRQSKANPAHPTTTAKPKTKIRPAAAPKAVDANPTYGTLFGEEEKVNKSATPPEESQYGTLFNSNKSGMAIGASLGGDDGGYLTQAQALKDLQPDFDDDYDEPMRPEILQLDNNGEGLYDIPDMFNSV